jgi:hypothetical protein
MKASPFLTIAALAVAGFFAGRGLRPAAVPSNPETATMEARHEAFRSGITAMMKGTPNSWTGVMALATRAQDTDDWIALLDAARLDPFLSQAIVRRWAEADPDACWEHLLTLGARILPPEHLATAAMEAWAARNPEDAVAALALARPQGKAQVDLRSDLGWMIVETALNLDLERGFALLPLPFSGGGFSFGNTRKWMENDPAKACRLIAGLPDGYVFQHELEAGARTWFLKDPEAALSWIGTLSQDLQKKALSKISEELAESGRVEKSRDLALTVDSMSARQSLAAPYLQHLRRTDPATGCAWGIANFDGGVMGSVIGNIVGNVDLKAFPPSLFLPYFDQMSDGHGKGQAARRFISKWMEQDGPAAIAWGEALDPRTREGALEFTDARWAANPASRTWLTTAPDTPFSQRVLAKIVENMDDPEEARAWAAELPPARAAQVMEALGNTPASSP